MCVWGSPFVCVVLTFPLNIVQKNMLSLCPYLPGSAANKICKKILLKNVCNSKLQTQIDQQSNWSKVLGILSVGSYLYMEASYGNTGDHALLRSVKTFPSAGDFCLKFYYYMKGVDIGKLMVSKYQGTEGNIPSLAQKLYEVQGRHRLYAPVKNYNDQII